MAPIWVCMCGWVPLSQPGKFCVYQALSRLSAQHPSGHPPDDLLHPSSLTHPVKPRQSSAFPKQKTFVLTILLPDVTPLMTVSHSELNQHPHPHTPLLAFLPSASLLIVQVSSTKFPNLSLRHQINLWEGRQLLCFVQCHTLSGTR